MLQRMSRVMYCEQCAIDGRPHDELLFSVIGQKSQKVWVYYYEAPTKREDVKPYGYTPHFIVLDKVIDGIVYFNVSCACNGCDVDIRYSNEKGWEIDIVKAHPKQLPIKEYLALEKFTDTGYKL